MGQLRIAGKCPISFEVKVAFDLETQRAVERCDVAQGNIAEFRAALAKIAIEVLKGQGLPSGSESKARARFEERVSTVRA